MNINSNELLLLKKIKFAGVNEAVNEGVNEGENTSVALKETPEQAQAAMNKLMFQGLKNVVSDPQLSQEVGTLNEVATQNADEVDSSKEYVAPFKSNLAFQGKAGKLKTYVAAAMMGLATLGSVATLQSCEKIEMNQSTTVDLDAIMSMISELTNILKEMKEQNAITNQKLTELTNYMMQLYEEVKNGNINAQTFYQKMFDYIVTSSANQELIIEQLIQNGMKQDEANKFLQNLINEVQAGRLSAEEALDQIKTLLGDIKGLLGQVVTALEKAEADRAELLQTAKDIKNGVNTSNEQIQILIAQNDSLIASNKASNEKLEDIAAKIEQSNIDNNANFDTVIKTLNMSKSQLIAVMLKIGYTQVQVEKMTAAQIVAAIKENTEVTKDNNAILQGIAEDLKSGRISAEEAAAEIIKLLGEINTNIKSLLDNFNSFYQDYKDDKATEFKYWNALVKENKIQTSVLLSMNKTVKNMDKNIKGIKANTEELLAIAKDDTKFNELIETLKGIQAGSVDYKKLEEMFKLMNMNIQDAIKMSSSELVAAIEKFQKTYVEVEQKQTEELQTIQSKIDDLQIFLINNNNKTDNKAVIDAINKLTEAVTSGNEDITGELKILGDKLDELQATVDAILKSVGDQAGKVDALIAQWTPKFDKILGSLDNIESQLSAIIANQKVASIYLSNIETEIKSLKAEIQKLQNQAGGSIDYDKLEEMWQNHDAANFERYSKLIKDLGINPDKLNNIEDLLKSIDSKMDYIKENSDILTKILNKLNGLDLANSQLEQIKNILENFKCNCECGKPNEGILGDLDKVLG